MSGRTAKRKLGGKPAASSCMEAATASPRLQAAPRSRLDRSVPAKETPVLVVASASRGSANRWRSSPPDRDRLIAREFIAAIQFLLPQLGLTAIEDHQVAFRSGATVHVVARLLEPLV